MIPSDSTAPVTLPPRSWFSRNWKWCVPAGLLLTAAWVWLVFRPSFRAGYFEEDKKEAAEAISQLHSRVSAGQFDQIYRDADSSLKDTQSKNALIQAMQGTRNKYGAFRWVTFSELNVIMGNPVQVRAVYNSTYEKGDTTELFTFVRRGNSLKLAYYSISPGTAKPEDRAANVAAAKKAAEELYAHVAAQDYGAIWDQANDEFKKSASRENLIDVLRQRYQKLGVCGPPSLVDLDFSDNDRGHFVGLVYQRKCEHGNLNERLAWQIVDGKALLRGYH
jgi:cytoskeletal protein RodZ